MMPDRDSTDTLGPEIIDLLTRLVMSGPIVDPDVRDPAADALIEVGLATFVVGPDHTILRATFSGRRLIADMMATRRPRGVR